MLVLIGFVGLLVVFAKIKAAPVMQQLLGEKKPGQTLTLSELNQHASEQDCFVTYRGEVFDITWFVDLHAGGLQIVSLCGQVADDFSPQHPGGSFDGPKIQAILSLSKIGVLAQ